jgi:hypothetical protein
MIDEVVRQLAEKYPTDISKVDVASTVKSSFHVKLVD